jgi:serine/threonine-protein kinase
MRSSEDTVDVADDQATVNALPPGAARARRPIPSTPLPQMSQQIALATLREEATGNARTMIWVGRAIGIAALLPLPFLGGSLVLRIAMAITVAISLVIGVFVERAIENPEVGERATAILGPAVSPAIFVAALYFGVFSAVQLFPAVALYFFCRRDNARLAFALYLLNAVAQAIAAALIIPGVVPDPGLITSHQSVMVNTVGHVLLQLGFLGAYMLGRGAQRASKEAIHKMQQAMHSAALKEALLAEARQELDRALAIDAPGRFTDNVIGDYRLGNIIGRGGMGEVYEAWHVTSGQIAAVKLLAVRDSDDPTSVERFLREVRAVKSLDSPHVVRVLAASDEQAPLPYLVMERLQGQDLATLLRGTTVAPSALLTMLGQIGAALEQAWAHGVVHRDLKPHNVFLCDDGTWKVLDFGVAALDDHSGTLTQGKVVGTPAYMAPEQARGEKVDHRADLYALAAIAYRWLTGRPVCGGKDLHAALYQTVHVMPQMPSTLADLPEDVDAALALGLAKNPDQRWTAIGELRDALSAALRGELDPRIRRRAADLLAAHPWGAVRG